MRQKTSMIFAMIYFLIALPSFSQKTEHFYNVDKEITLEGKIQKIAMEPRYENRSPFLIITVEEKDTKKLYIVEISPVGFFDQDFHKGEHLMITGSLTSSEGTETAVIAREVQSGGETFILRDKHGFPTWRGGKGLMNRKGKRKGKRF
jgi:RecG-like helicase